MFPYWNCKWNMPDCRLIMEGIFGLSWDHKHLWLCFKSFPQRNGLHKIEFYFCTQPSWLHFFLSNGFWNKSGGLCYKSTFAKALDYISKTTVQTHLIVTWSLGIKYFRWLVLPCLNLYEPYILNFQKYLNKLINLKQILGKSFKILP